MNIDAATMTVPYYEARKQYEAYRDLVKSRRVTAEDEQLRRAYSEIVRGKKVIDIQSAIATAGLTEAGLPKLAIARAHWPTVHTWRANGRFWFTLSGRVYSYRGSIAQRGRNVSVAMTAANVDNQSGKAQVPRIPAEHRPKGALTAYHLLFEAVWEPTPPTDPILLRHIGGPFYVALAQWDLSPLERAVLRARL